MLQLLLHESHNSKGDTFVMPKCLKPVAVF